MSSSVASRETDERARGGGFRQRRPTRRDELPLTVDGAKIGRGAGDVGARVDLHRDAPPRLAYRSRLSLGTSGSSGGSSGSSMVPGRDDAPPFAVDETPPGRA